MKLSSALISCAVFALAITAQAEQLLKKTVDISNINGLELHGHGTLTLSQGDTESLTIVAKEKTMRQIEVDARGTVLRIRVKNKKHWGIFSFDNNVQYTLNVKRLNHINTLGNANIIVDTDLSSENLTVERTGNGNISFQDISTQSFEMEASGAGNFKANEISANEIELSTSGAGNIDANILKAKQDIDLEISGSSNYTFGEVYAEHLEIDIAGAGNVNIECCQVNTQSIDIAGAGNYRAGGLESRYADLDLAGAAHAEVWITESIDAEANGASSIKYYGEPHVKNVDSSGASSIKKIGDKPKRQFE